MHQDERPAKIRKLSHHERDSPPQSAPAADMDAPMQDAATATAPMQDAATAPDAGITPTQPPTAQPLADATEATISSSTPNHSAGTTTATPTTDNTATATTTPANPSQPPTTASTTTGTTSSDPPLSKSMQKKLRKQAEWDAKKGERKIWRKEKNQAKKERKREERRTNPDAWKEKQKAWVRPTMLPITFVIDCDFDDLMRDNERISLGGQLTRCYSDNKNAAFRAHLAVCSFNGKLRERFDGILNKSYQNWKGVRFLDQDFVHAAEKAKEWMADDKKGGRLGSVFAKYAPAQPTIIEEQPQQPEPEQAMPSNIDETQDTKPETAAKPKQPQSIKPNSLPAADLEALHAQAETIYLSADSDVTLTELKPFSTYIIGGLVDKNREKGICQARAEAAGVKTARLPIGDYLAMASRKVLTTNHVHEIMLKWLECGDWGEAFMKVIPKRKGGQLRGYAGEGGDEGEDDEGDAENENDHVEDVDEVEEKEEDDAEEQNEQDAELEQNAGAASGEFESAA